MGDKESATKPRLNQRASKCVREASVFVRNEVNTFRIKMAATLILASVRSTVPPSKQHQIHHEGKKPKSLKMFHSKLVKVLNGSKLDRFVAKRKKNIIQESISQVNLLALS